MPVKQMGVGMAGKGYGAVIQNPGAWLLSDGKASLAEIICFRGKTCTPEADDLMKSARGPNGTPIAAKVTQAPPIRIVSPPYLPLHLPANIYPHVEQGQGAGFNAPNKAMLVFKSQMLGTSGTNLFDCDYLVRSRFCLGRAQCAL